MTDGLAKALTRIIKDRKNFHNASVLFLMWLKMKNCEVLVVLSAIFVTAHGAARNKTNFQANKPQPAFIDDDYCFENPDVTLAPHKDCAKYWGCDELGAFENDCGPGEIFDTELLFCGNSTYSKACEFMKKF